MDEAAGYFDADAPILAMTMWSAVAGTGCPRPSVHDAGGRPRCL